MTSEEIVNQVNKLLEQQKKYEEVYKRKASDKYYFYVADKQTREFVEKILPDAKVFTTDFAKPYEVMMVDKDFIDYPFGGKELYED